jgi:hypothetical protein
MYQCLVKLQESRSAGVLGPLSFATREEREEYVRGPKVFWYHLVEIDDWHVWHRGGAWKATAVSGPEDRVPEPPEITEEDRW